MKLISPIYQIGKMQNRKVKEKRGLAKTLYPKANRSLAACVPKHFQQFIVDFNPCFFTQPPSVAEVNRAMLFVWNSWNRTSQLVPRVQRRVMGGAARRGLYELDALAQAIVQWIAFNPRWFEEWCQLLCRFHKRNTTFRADWYTLDWLFKPWFATSGFGDVEGEREAADPEPADMEKQNLYQLLQRNQVWQELAKYDHIFAQPIRKYQVWQETVAVIRQAFNTKRNV